MYKHSTNWTFFEGGTPDCAQDNSLGSALRNTSYWGPYWKLGNKSRLTPCKADSPPAASLLWTHILSFLFMFRPHLSVLIVYSWSALRDHFWLARGPYGFWVWYSGQPLWTRIVQAWILLKAIQGSVLPCALNKETPLLGLQENKDCMITKKSQKHDTFGQNALIPASVCLYI